MASIEGPRQVLKFPQGRVVSVSAGATELLADKLPSHRRGRELPRPHRVDPSGRRGAAEQNNEWTEARRYMGLDLLTKARLHPVESETDETALPTELTA
jgi:hypothetical protein